MSHNVFEGNTYKYILTGVDVASRHKIVRVLKIKKLSEAAFVLEAIYKKGGVFKYYSYFNVIMGLSLKKKGQGCLKNKMLIFEKRQRNTSIIIRPLWKPLTKSWKNCCLNQWMAKSFKTLKKNR